MAATAASDVHPDDRTVREALSRALVSGALPGETDGLDEAARAEAVSFLAEAAAVRRARVPEIRLETISGEGPRRRMRLVVINDDMPFIVDSVANTVTARGLAIHRLLHPVVAVRRDATGRLVAVAPAGSGGAPRESMLYLEIERADARARRQLIAEIGRALADVRAAVEDWQPLQDALRGDAERLGDGEGAALLRWLVDGNFTLLAHGVEDRDGALADGALGLLRADDAPLWSDVARRRAFAHFEGGGGAPLVIKAGRVSTVHRRAPLDLLVVPVVGHGRLTGLSIHAGLWTSAALATPPEEVPILRERLAAIERKFGFAATGHAGKSLRHVLSTLPHDLLIGISPGELETLALTAMSLIDRPRPKLLLVADALRRHAFAFAWVPRDEMSTARRVMICHMLEKAAKASVGSWSIDLDGGALALIRYMLVLPEGGGLPDVAALDARLVEMVRGWVPGVEAELGKSASATQAARLAISYAAGFPAGYRARYDAGEAAHDIRGLHALGTGTGRGVRLFRVEGDPAGRVHLKIYRRSGLVTLSEAVPVLENFGFRVIEEVPTLLDGGRLGNIHDFLLEVPDADVATALLGRAAAAEAAITAVLDGRAEDDEFNALIGLVGLGEPSVLLLRAWFRYLRQTGLSYGLATVALALRRAPAVTRAILDLFAARHDPRRAGDDAAAAERALEAALASVAAIDDDRILRRLAAVVRATLRTNAFVPAADEALAFKLDSKLIPGLPAPVPWREIFVYSPRIEGVHLRGGPVARGGIRWSDRRDDFRTEILGLMKAQVVKNAVIVPTGAKGGFYPKRLPPASDREAWLAEGTESYRIFIRALLSVTDNIVEGAVVHPEGVRLADGDDPYFVVAADKGTAKFSDIANAIALERGFWLGDAFASGGSVGYDHKAMGITARGAWVSVQRHFAEMGIDVQRDPVTVAGVGDMSGDVFGNGMLLSKAIRLVAAFDHRHIFLDPDPDPARSWDERARLFALPRSSWADYDASLISEGGGVFPRDQKEIPLSPQVKALLGVEADSLDPSTLLAAILKAEVDLLWFGGIGTYVKARDESNAEVGDNANDAHRVNGEDVRAKVIGEGANLATTQAGRIAYATAGGRLNTDFIDNSAGVDCSDNEVNIKIALNAEVKAGRLAIEDRNALLVEMTDDVAALVLEDNRLQTLALSIAERGGAAALPSQMRVIEIMEASGRLDREVEGLESNEELLRRVQDGKGLTRPELAVLLSHSKLALQAAIEASPLPDDPSLRPILQAAFPEPMQARFAAAIDAHRLRREILATRIANLVVNRLGILLPFELAEEEGASLAQVAGAYLAADALFGASALWRDIEAAAVPEPARLELFRITAAALRVHMADLLRAAPAEVTPGQVAASLSEGIARIDGGVESLLRDEARSQIAALRATLAELVAGTELTARIVRIVEMDGAVGAATLARQLGVSEFDVSRAYVRLGEALALDWAKAAAMRASATDPWERLLLAGLAREFEQLRLDFLARVGDGDPSAAVEAWLLAQAPRVAQFTGTVARARAATAPNAAMLAQISHQARGLLSR